MKYKLIWKRITALFIAVVLTFIVVPTIEITTAVNEYPTPEGYSENDYQKLVAFALQGDNLSRLKWDLEDPASWSRIIWNDDLPRTVCTINFNGEYGSDYTGVYILFSGELNVSGFTSLEWLDICENRINKVNISNTPALRVLLIEDNELTEIDVSGNLALETFYCSYNDIAELNVSNNFKLKQLRCSYNQLKELNVSNNSELYELWVDYNLLTQIDVSKNSKLRELWVGNNQLTGIDVSKNSMLEILHCDTNMLTSISSFENLTNLYWVGVYNNYLDLESLVIKSSIAKIQATVNDNFGKGMFPWYHGFSYSIQRTPPNPPVTTEHPLVDTEPFLTTDETDSTTAILDSSPTEPSTISEPKYDYIIGRIISKDSETTIFDALEILKALVGMESKAINNPAALITEQSKLRGEPDIFDALEILKMLVGMENGVYLHGTPTQ